MPDQKTFYLIDGHAQIFRAYYAPMRELTSPTGEPTKATQAFVQSLLNLIDKRKPDYLAMVIDSGDETVFRREIDPNYKANRRETPDDFHPQEQRILRIVADAGIPIFVKPGFEADDILATFAEQLSMQGFKVVLISRDKDLRQVVSDSVTMYDVQDDTTFDPAYIESKFGYRPDQAVEIQTLKGDSTDNIPGVPGVGDKTAVDLIKQFGTADEAVRRADEITKPKLRESLKAFAPQLPITRQLVTLRKDVDLPIDPEACVFKGLNRDGIAAHLRELGFRNIIARLGLETPSTQPAAKPVGRGKPKPADEGGWGLFSSHDSVDAASAGGDGSRAAESGSGPDGSSEPGGSAGASGERLNASPPDDGLRTTDDCDYVLVDTPEGLSDLVAELKKHTRFAFDTETDALGATSANLIGMSFAVRPGAGWYVAVRGPESARVIPPDIAVERVRGVLEDASIGKIGHNIKYDLNVMRCVGVRVRGVVMDTMIAAFVLDAGRSRFGIDDLAAGMLSIRKIPTNSLIGKGKDQRSMKDAPLDQVARYAAEDADVCLRLAELLEPQLDAAPELRKLIDTLEIPLIDVLAEMEFNGIAIAPEVLREQSVAMGLRIDALRKQVVEAAGVEFNTDSPKQLQEVLFNRLGLKAGKKTKTGYSTDVQELERLAGEHAVPRLIIEYRGLVKLKGTYLDSLADQVNPRTGRIHTSFHQTGAATGRLSSSDPNLQNIPIRTDEGRRIRLAFVPGSPENVLLTADYSQIELRMLAHLTQEPALLRAFEEDLDIHQAVAAEVFGVPLEQVTREQRGKAKTVNFGIIYGIGAYGLSQRIEGLSVPAAAELIASYHARFPGIEGFFNACVADAQQMGYVKTILGRRRPLPEIRSGVVAQRKFAERQAINSVVQGSAADLIKQAMLNVQRALHAEKSPSKLLLQVHDELVLETPAVSVESQAALVRREMLAAGPQLGIGVPLKADAGWGRNWQEVK